MRDHEEIKREGEEEEKEERNTDRIDNAKVGPVFMPIVDNSLPCQTIHAYKPVWKGTVLAVEHYFF